MSVAGLAVPDGDDGELIGSVPVADPELGDADSAGELGTSCCPAPAGALLCSGCVWSLCPRSEPVGAVGGKESVPPTVLGLEFAVRVGAVLKWKART